ncbi:30S ribosomal protein S6 [Candidatus Daviesbacteria bacterium RIFCSPHIGHO2_01_FULL_44_29]|uniref:Small ribosomal subunit protein bS6 n=1 Tax=Candidatus Daviesbacteria bacterium RIFCSPHIGHO2_02_FULL_43_12 TaxID=1797776 RepID=A0A1F5KHC9_9BACT|nr:MAG: 30S ribosomal protein S6 [Candidatus Daviesbacteria bacterium RIFCSPHIGHO2_01_FULL_44_29]OGE39380.1 MAG: 30S ribosomal protein S6 [Candidatus Daviesbacteria bacterium RIFCSPHIGHO2_12_FULL_47_45]OGE40259.1 MAG: 30S ribosomal protein S6 [Candidatus Daviesbacteria bacterium RIFCSPHIGHO2_02_FULL_43_12]OGE69058.1 MAG: 30S ribosomal protein S6 [Candidatus Daviesbacteria bacterium RIFCSPLOWO2_01_FULL_43_15]
MNSYQLTVVVKPSIEDSERKELLAAITKQFGKATKEELWGNRDLAYPIEHLLKAYYAHYEFEGDPKTIAALDKSMKLNEDILRYLLIRR